METGMPPALRDLIVQHLHAGPQDIVPVNGILGLAQVGQLIPDDRPDHIFKPYEPRYPERILEHDGDCFSAIREKDIVIHHPFESFDVVVDFLRQAARDPAVGSIKQTLYRTSGDSPIVQALIDAAEAGKQVLAMEAYARALRAMPMHIADNAGYDSAELVSTLRAKHYEGLHNYGLEMDNGKVADMNAKDGPRIWEPYAVKVQTVKTAIEASSLILRVDDIVSGIKGQK